MSHLKTQLIRLGETRPDLQDDLRPIIASLPKTGSTRDPAMKSVEDSRKQMQRQLKNLSDMAKKIDNQDFKSDLQLLMDKMHVMIKELDHLLDVFEGYPDTYRWDVYDSLYKSLKSVMDDLRWGHGFLTKEEQQRSRFDEYALKRLDKFITNNHITNPAIREHVKQASRVASIDSGAATISYQRGEILIKIGQTTLRIKADPSDIGDDMRDFPVEMRGGVNERTNATVFVDFEGLTILGDAASASIVPFSMSDLITLQEGGTVQTKGLVH